MVEFERVGEVVTTDADDPAHQAVCDRLRDELRKAYPHVSGWMIEGRGEVFKIWNKVLRVRNPEKGRMGYLLHAAKLITPTDFTLAAREAGGTILEDYGVRR